MRKPRFVMIMGAPFTGRHPLANELGKLMGCEVISSRHIRRKKFPGQDFSPRQDKVVFKEVNERIIMALTENRDVIVVGMNRKGANRRDAVEYAHENGYEAICVYCTKSLKAVLQENSERLAPLPANEIEQRFRMASRPPAAAEGWDSVYKVNLNAKTYLNITPRPQSPMLLKCA